VFTSAIDGKRIDRVLEHTVSIYAERAKRVKTGVFNTFLDQIVHDHAPTGNRKSHKPKIYYGSQVDSNPPKFLISVNKAEHFHFSYKRYIENKIREFFGFEGTPIDVEIRGRLSIYKKENRHGNKTVIHKDDSEKHTDERERADREKAKRAPKTAEEKKKILKKRSVTKGKGSAKKGEEE
jgi:GTP-binding protein